MYWQQAHAMDALIYSYERIKEKDPNTADKYKRYMGLWYENHANNWYYDKNDPTGFVNDYTDDMCGVDYNCSLGHSIVVGCFCKDYKQ